MISVTILYQRPYHNRSFVVSTFLLLRFAGPYNLTDFEFFFLFRSIGILWPSQYQLIGGSLLLLLLFPLVSGAYTFLSESRPET